MHNCDKATHLLKRAIAYGCLFSVLGLKVAGCGAPPTPVPFISGGLGLTRAEFEARYPGSYKDGWYVIDGYHFDVDWWYPDDSSIDNATVRSICYNATSYPATPPTDRALDRFFPADARLLAGATPDRILSILGLYDSPSLLERFPAVRTGEVPWGKYDRPGSFFISELHEVTLRCITIGPTSP